MIEHLDGIFETVTFRENMQIRISDMDICEDFPDHWHTPMEIIHATKNWYKIVVDGRTYRLNEGLSAPAPSTPSMRRTLAAEPSIWQIYHS